METAEQETNPVITGGEKMGKLSFQVARIPFDMYVYT